MLKDNIKKYRLKANLTQRELSNLSGVSYSSITKLENGTLKNPSTGILACIAIVLHVNIEDLLSSDLPKKNPFKAIDSGHIAYLKSNGYDEGSWHPFNADSKTNHLLKYSLRDDLLLLEGYQIIFDEDDASLFLKGNGRLYEIDADLDDLINSTQDFFRFKLNDILEKSRIVKED